MSKFKDLKNKSFNTLSSKEAVFIKGGTGIVSCAPAYNEKLRVCYATYGSEPAGPNSNYSRCVRKAYSEYLTCLKCLRATGSTC